MLKVSTCGGTTSISNKALDIDNELAHIINAIACPTNATACMRNTTYYIGIGATDIAIVTIDMTNAVRYISIAAGQVKGVSGR